MATCPSCGREQDRPSAFCTSCGAVLDRPAAESTAPAQPAPNLPPEARQVFPGPPQPASPDHGDVGAYIVRRFLALLVDVVVAGVLIALAARAWLTRGTNGELTFGAFVQLTFVLAIALFAYRWLFSGIVGSTPGKLLFGLVVGRNGGGRAGIARTFVRELILPLDLVVIGFLLAALLPRRQRLGDLVAGTVVVNSKIGALAPLLGILLVGGATYATVSYAGGVAAADRLASDASHYATGLMNRSSPSPSPTSAPSPMETVPVASPSPEPTATSNVSPTVKPRTTPTPNPTPSTTV